MKLSRKLRKLLSGDSAGSIFEHITRSLHPVSVRGVMATLDSDAVANLERRYPRTSTSPKINRFADVAYWIGINVERAQDLWLDRSPALRILDLGCGAGYFLYVCRLFGHDVLGLDLDDHQLFRDTLAMLNVPRVVSRIQPNTALPDLGRRFDLVAAHRICFQRIGGARSGEEWSTSHWKFFIDDVRSRLLTPRGRLLLDFNPRPDGTSFFTSELRSFFKSQNAVLRRSKALLSADPKELPAFRKI